MNFGVVVTWDAGFFGTRSYTLKANSGPEAEKQGLDLAWKELENLDIAKQWKLRKSQLHAISGRLNAAGTGRYGT
jgi:hypothetical protein